MHFIYHQQPSGFVETTKYDGEHIKAIGGKVHSFYDEEVVTYNLSHCRSEFGQPLYFVDGKKTVLTPSIARDKLVESILALQYYFSQSDAMAEIDTVYRKAAFEQWNSHFEKVLLSYSVEDKERSFDKSQILSLQNAYNNWLVFSEGALILSLDDVFETHIPINIQRCLMRSALTVLIGNDVQKLVDKEPSLAHQYPIAFEEYLTDDEESKYIVKSESARSNLFLWLTS
jgi:hypothetical protein